MMSEKTEFQDETMREWEALVRTQLAAASGPGQLFSPLDLPEDF